MNGVALDSLLTLAHPSGKEEKNRLDIPDTKREF
jgi:hypothetical protein